MNPPGPPTTGGGAGRRAPRPYRTRRGQSALTDFLASNNISAQQIREDYERRVREADQAQNAGEGTSNATAAQQSTEDSEAAEATAVETDEEEFKTARKRKRNEKQTVEKIKKAKLSKKKAAAAAKKGKKVKKGNDDDDDDSDDDYDDGLTNAMYTKSRPLPGQLENCEMCNKRFTVTPYSKTGPDGGLLCLPCGKELDKDSKAEKKAQAKKPVGRKRRQAESKRLDGVVSGGAKTLQQLCIEKAARHHEDVEELGEMPDAIVDRLAEIFAKKRLINSRTLKLFTRPDMEVIKIHDAAYLDIDDYKQMFAITPKLKKLVLRNACQVKDECLEYMMERCDKLTHVHLYAANLVSNDMWRQLFRHYGAQLDTLKLMWLDAAFEDDTVEELVEDCPNLQRLKLKLCRRIGEDSISAIAKLNKLEHLSLQIGTDVTSETLVDLIESVGPNLRTLSLEKFMDADDTVLAAIKTSCTKLQKLRLAENDVASDAAYTDLFTNWKNPPLSFADFSSTRDVDNNNSEGPEDPIGLASNGFTALMKHSGSQLKTLDIASCRHISLGAFMGVFDGKRTYSNLESINLSFCSYADTAVIAGIFKSCPAIKKVVTFGCFGVLDVVIPRGITLIGAPKAQDAIEQFGTSGMDLMSALGRMVDVEA